MTITVLEMTQDILSAMDSDEVNSINDTIEAQQVATIIKHCYNDIATLIDLPEQYEIFHLDASLDPSQPTVMYVPQAYENLEWLRYDKRGSDADVSSSTAWTSPDGILIHFGTDEATWSANSANGSDNIQYTPLTFLPRKDFLKNIYAFDSNSSNVLTYNIETEGMDTTFLCKNDKQPDYYTVFSNNIVVFDSYDATVDTTLQSSKTFAYGKRSHSFVLTDDWEIDLDSKYLSLLYNEAKSTCFLELKQMPNARAEKNARRGWIKTQKAKASVPYGDPALNSLPNYGRKIR